MFKRILRLFTLLVVAAALFGCAEQRFYIAGYADLWLHPHNPKALIFSGDMNTGRITDVRWGRVCEVADCTMYGPAKGAGVATITPAACYSRWWKECDGKRCRSDWWERCAKQESRKSAVVESSANGPFTECTLIQQTSYNSDPPPVIPQKPLLIYRCLRADGTAQNFYKF